MTYTVLGINDDRDSCQCCGKTGLKRVVWIRNDDTGEVVHYGTTCAMSPEKGMGADQQIKAALSKADHLLGAINTATNMQYRRAGGRYAVNDTGRGWTPADQSLWDRIRAQVVAQYKKANGPVFPMNGSG